MVDGQRIKRRRKEQGETLKSIAAQVGISVGFLCDIEQGHRRPSRAIAEKLLEVLGLPPLIACSACKGTGFEVPK